MIGYGTIVGHEVRHPEERELVLTLLVLYKEMCGLRSCDLLASLHIVEVDIWHAS